jgi:hypothetical protein
MNTKTATISKNRQIAIPASFGLQAGEKVKMTFDYDKNIITINKIPNPVEQLFGLAKDLNFSSEDFLKEKKTLNLKRNKKLKLVK